MKRPIGSVVSLHHHVTLYVTEISHLYSLRDFWRHFGLCRAAAHSDCCFFAPCTNILTYLLMSSWFVLAVKQCRHSESVRLPSRPGTVGEWFGSLAWLWRFSATPDWSRHWAVSWHKAKVDAHWKMRCCTNGNSYF